MSAPAPDDYMTCTVPQGISTPQMTIRDAIDLMIDKRVRKLCVHGEFDIELAAEAFVPRPKLGPDGLPVQNEPDNDPNVCTCGHASFEHMNDTCTRGCDLERCMGDHAGDGTP